MPALTGIKRRRAAARLPGGPRCSYETVVCQACSGLHFLHRSTGKLLGAKER
jgi:hypothetical protein